ncbi:ribosomal protein L15 [Ramicandelaber brevisporus]|nr:ribosomal protein L15 [Ramicandelaber brevisporus]
MIAPGRQLAVRAARQLLSRSSRTSASIVSHQQRTFSVASPARSLAPVSAAFKVDIPDRKVVVGAIRDNDGAKKKKRRVGRGPGSGMGKTSGRGHKGQKARGGSWMPGPAFEGGQTPISKRFPKRGFVNPMKRELRYVNLDKLQQFVVTGRLDASQTITMKHLRDAGCVGTVKDGVVLLGRGSPQFNVKINIEVTKASQEAIRAIEAAGGSIRCIYYSRVPLRKLHHPELYDTPAVSTIPPTKRLKEWYADIKNRGHLVGVDIYGPRGGVKMLPLSLDSKSEAVPTKQQK